MAILNNLDGAWDEEFYFDESLYKPELQNLSQKLFSDMVCTECESKPMPVTDNMGREIFWEDIGRPTNA
jgi:hypothetical protein